MGYIVRNAKQSLDAIQKHISSNAFTHLRPTSSILAEASAAEESSSTSKSNLNGRLIAIKDNICTKGTQTTCASNILADFIPPYDATAVSRLSNAGAIIVGKTNMDEFGMGSHSVNSAFGPVRNHNNLSAGGSSGGSAVAVAMGMCHAALGSDTGGSVRLPAAYCGVVGYKPSYGRISRYGLVAYANSLDTVGVLAGNVEDVRTIFEECLDGFDAADPTSLGILAREEIRKLVQRRNEKRSGDGKSRRLRVGIPKELNTVEISQSVRESLKRAITGFRKLGHEVTNVSLPSIKHALSAYYVIAPAEASSNLAKYDGFRYGMMSNTNNDNKEIKEPKKAGYFFRANRAKGLGTEVRRRILLGSYTLSAEAFDNYFIQAQKVRQLLIQDFDRAFKLPNALSSSGDRSRSTTEDEDNRGVDVLLCPTSMTGAPLLEEALEKRTSPLENYVNDYFTVPASLAGIPAITVPLCGGGGSKVDGEIPVGLQLMAQYGDDGMLLEAARVLEEL